ncbi:MAG: TIGR00730 family Rossman fold protein [Rhodospirillales bacterium]|nr:TIGR00730 family Rossman fold protein [Rhodospirillales bacterium]MCB9996902.1 TIGR00730 family Rossman fold protein [Rhodospirillales bacterium]
MTHDAQDFNTHASSSAPDDKNHDDKKYGVAVFGASSMMFDPGHEQDAIAVGKGLARNGDLLIYGGGSRGLMGVVSETAIREGGEIRGYMMECFTEAVQYPQKDYELMCKTIAERKQKMLLDADAYIALGGGFGTLDEILEAGVEQYLGGYVEPPVKMKPIILVNRNGIYDPFMAQLDKFIEEGAAKAAVKDFFILVNNGEEAIDMLEQLKKQPGKPAVAVGNVQTPPPAKPN